MDIRRDGWFGQLVLSGVKQPQAHRGSIMHIVSESLKDLTQQRVRNDADGESEIVIRIRNKAFDTSKESAQYMDKSIEVDSLLESNEILKPEDGEDYDHFMQRLKEAMISPMTARMIAAEWYGLKEDSALRAWLEDHKANRFRVLNTRDEAFNNALPGEYEALKDYVIQMFPSFVKDMRFRTA